MPTITDIQHLRDWTGDVLWIASALAVVACLVAWALDTLAERDARRSVEESAERRHLQAVMAERETSR